MKTECSPPKKVSQRGQGTDWEETLRTHQFIYHSPCTKLGFNKSFIDLVPPSKNLQLIQLTLIAIKILSFYSLVCVPCSLMGKANKIRVTIGLMRLPYTDKQFAFYQVSLQICTQKCKLISNCPQANIINKASLWGKITKMTHQLIQ